MGSGDGGDVDAILPSFLWGCEGSPSLSTRPGHTDARSSRQRHDSCPMMHLVASLDAGEDSRHGASSDARRLSPISMLLCDMMEASPGIWARLPPSTSQADRQHGSCLIGSFPLAEPVLLFHGWSHEEGHMTAQPGSCAPKWTVLESAAAPTPQLGPTSRTDNLCR